MIDNSGRRWALQRFVEPRQVRRLGQGAAVFLPTREALEAVFAPDQNRWELQCPPHHSVHSLIGYDSWTMVTTNDTLSLWVEFTRFFIFLYQLVGHLSLFHNLGEFRQLLEYQARLVIKPGLQFSF